jgi:deoxyribodipyrimidine photolyase
MHAYLAQLEDAPEVIKVIYKALIDTGRVSNYGRMLFATWTYDIGANWRLGEELFAKNLLDYDYCSNHWNWAHHSVQGMNFSWPGKKYKIDNVRLYV